VRRVADRWDDVKSLRKPECNCIKQFGKVAVLCVCCDLDQALAALQASPHPKDAGWQGMVDALLKVKKRFGLDEEGGAYLMNKAKMDLDTARAVELALNRVAPSSARISLPPGTFVCGLPEHEEAKSALPAPPSHDTEEL
jgi:hypothetical protein